MSAVRGKNAKRGLEKSSETEFISRLLQAAHGMGWIEDTSVSKNGSGTEFTLTRGSREIKGNVLPRLDRGRGRIVLMTEMGTGADLEETEAGWRFRLGGFVIGSLEGDPGRILEIIGSDE